MNPSGSKSILITLENESQIQHFDRTIWWNMQKASFFNDIGRSVEKPKIFREKSDKELKATQRHMLLWFGDNRNQSL